MAFRFGNARHPLAQRHRRLAILDAQQNLLRPHLLTLRLGLPRRKSREPCGPPVEALCDLLVHVLAHELVTKVAKPNALVAQLEPRVERSHRSTVLDSGKNAKSNLAMALRLVNARAPMVKYHRRLTIVDAKQNCPRSSLPLVHPRVVFVPFNFLVHGHPGAQGRRQEPVVESRENAPHEAPLPFSLRHHVYPCLQCHACASVHELPRCSLDRMAELPCIGNAVKERFKSHLHALVKSANLQSVHDFAVPRFPRPDDACG